jgi:hypothetical protein
MGKFRAGGEEIEIPLGTRLLAYMPSLTTGWIKWQDGWEGERAAASNWGFVGDGFKAPQRESLGDNDPAQWWEHQDPWCPRHALGLIDIRTGEVFSFVALTRADVCALADLVSIYCKRGRLPIVELSTVSRCQGMLQIHRPKFEVIGWYRGDAGENAPPPRVDAPLEKVL